MVIPGPDSRCLRLIRALICVWILGLVLALYPYTEDPATPVKVLFSAAMLVIVAGVWTVGLFRNSVGVRPPGAPIFLLFLFLAVQCAAAALSGTPSRGMHALLPWVTFATLGFFAHQAFSNARHLRLLFRAIVAAVALSAAYGLGQKVGLDPFPWATRELEEYRGLPATYGHPNFAGHALVIAITLAAGLLVDAFRRGGRWFECAAYGAAIGLLATHLYFTSMRGGLVALALGATAVAVTLGLRRYVTRASAAWMWGLAASAGLMVIAGVGLLLLAPWLSLDRPLQLRLHGYAGAAAMFLDKPLTGVGPGNYGFENIPYWSDFEALWYALSEKRNLHAHNEWLEIAAESGVLGLFTVILLWLRQLMAPFHRPEPRSVLRYCLPIVLLVAAIDACFGFNLHVPVSAGIILLLLCLDPDGHARWLLPNWGTRAGALALLFLCLVFAAQSGWQFQGERRYQQARGALAWAREHADEAPRFRRVAYKLFHDAQRLLPMNYRPPLALGNLALVTDGPGEAIPHLKHAESMHPYLPRIQLLLGRAYLESAQRGSEADSDAALKAAREHARNAVEMANAQGEAHALLAWTHWNDEEHRDDYIDLVVDELESARRFGMAENPAVAHVLAQALHEREMKVIGDTPITKDSIPWLTLAFKPPDRPWGSAGQMALRAVSIAPATISHWDSLARIANYSPGWVQTDYRQALLHHLTTTSDLDNELRDTLAFRLSTLHDAPVQNRVVERNLIRTLNRNPESDALWSAWVRTLPESNATSLFLKQASAMGDSAGPVTRAVADVLSASGPGLMAWEKLAESLAQDPGQETPALNKQRLGPLLALLPGTTGHGMLAMYEGRIAFYIGDWNRARILLQDAQKNVPAAFVGDLHYYLSRVLAAQGKNRPALAHARAALQADKASARYQWNFALRLADVGDRDAARFQLEAVRRQFADSPARLAAIDGALANLHRAEAAP